MCKHQTFLNVEASFSLKFKSSSSLISHKIRVEGNLVNFYTVEYPWSKLLKGQILPSEISQNQREIQGPRSHSKVTLAVKSHLPRSDHQIST